MGQRQLKVTPEALVEFLKGFSGAARSYTVEHALPDDAKLVYTAYERDAGGTLLLTLESSEWHGEIGMALEPPMITVHYGDGGG